MRHLLSIVITVALLAEAWRMINVWPDLEAPDGAYMGDDEFSFVFNTN
jgi:hypothetical protein